MQPLDVVKTRLQTVHAPGGMMGAIRSIYSTSAGVLGLWRGFGPGLAIVVPRRGFKFFANGMFASYLGDSAVASLVAGGAAGACEALLITPLETVKVQMQSHGCSAGQVVARLRCGGVSTFYTGVGPTIAKHSAHSCVYFAMFRASQPKAREALCSKVRGDLAAGFIAGCAAGTVNNPFDVLKSRAQATAHAEPKAGGQSVLLGLMRIARDEGVSACFAGWTAKVARLGPGSAIIFAVYHAALEALEGVS